MVRLAEIVGKIAEVRTGGPRPSIVKENDMALFWFQKKDRTLIADAYEALLVLQARDVKVVNVAKKSTSLSNRTQVFGSPGSQPGTSLAVVLARLKQCLDMPGDEGGE